MKKVVYTIFVGVLAIFVLSSCGENGGNAPALQSNSNSKSEMQVTYRSVEEESYEGAAYGGSDSAELDADKLYEQEEKRILNAYLDLYVYDFDGAVSQIKDIIKKEGGYVESYNAYINRYTSTDEALKSAEMKLRVPSKRYSITLETVQALGDVTYISEAESNVTDQYYDIKARMEAKAVEEERVLAMIEKAVKIQDLIELEKRLSDIRSEIERYQASMNVIDKDTAYSTITLRLNQKEDGQTIRPISDDFFTKIKNSFLGSINGIVIFFQNTIIFIAGVSVPLIVIAVPIIVVFLISRKRNNKNKSNIKEKERMNRHENESH